MCYSQAAEPSRGVRRKTLQIEIEVQFANEKEGMNSLDTWMVPNTLLPYGISNRFELQLNSTYLGERFQDANNLTYTSHRFDDTPIGTSINLWSQ